MSAPDLQRIAFIGGGNMASAILGGLLRQGFKPEQFCVVEPFEAQRTQLKSGLGIAAFASAAATQPELAAAQLVIWAVKPQQFKEAALACKTIWAIAAPLHLSVAAGIRTSSMAAWLGSTALVRAMPNTPALIGQGMSGLYATPLVSATQRAWVDQVMRGTGQFVWLTEESQLDAVTALSGSGPAYVFYVVEAMVQAGVEMGLPADQAKQLALATFTGAAALAAQSPESVGTLRERVTSKGGTTYAALTSLESDRVQAAFGKALHAAQRRAVELGNELGD
jgi:pyrroline-5-carboxylate reductase